jgi:hypothetical protein
MRESHILPEEPGIYEAAAFPVADGFMPYVLHDDGTWIELADSGDGPFIWDSDDLALNGPMRRLVPEQET